MIFASPAVQAVFDEVATKPAIGDYQHGVKAFTLCQARNGYIPDGPTPTNYAELDAYHARVKVFEQGYDEAAQDERHKTICELVRTILKHRQ